MLYEIINPSDKIVIEAFDDKLAAVAVLALGQGDYGLYTEDGTLVVPIFRLSNETALFRWLDARGLPSTNMDAFYAEHRFALADILESMTYGDFANFKEFAAEIEGMTSEARLDKRTSSNEARRTSATNIFANACALAKSLRGA